MNSSGSWQNPPSGSGPNSGAGQYQSGPYQRAGAPPRQPVNVTPQRHHPVRNKFLTAAAVLLGCVGGWEANAWLHPPKTNTVTVKIPCPPDTQKATIAGKGNKGKKGTDNRKSLVHTVALKPEKKGGPGTKTQKPPAGKVDKKSGSQSGSVKTSENLSLLPNQSATVNQGGNAPQGGNGRQAGQPPYAGPADQGMDGPPVAVFQPEFVNAAFIPFFGIGIGYNDFGFEWFGGHWRYHDHKGVHDCGAPPKGWEAKAPHDFLQKNPDALHPLESASNTNRAFSTPHPTSSAVTGHQQPMQEPAHLGSKALTAGTEVSGSRLSPPAATVRTPGQWIVDNQRAAERNNLNPAMAGNGARATAGVANNFRRQEQGRYNNLQTKVTSRPLAPGGYRRPAAAPRGTGAVAAHRR